MSRIFCKATKIEEAGYYSSSYGLSLSFRTDFTSPFELRYPEKVAKVMERLKFKETGENKFLEHIETWWSIILPRYAWAQVDTYRIGISKQSGSTMHSLLSILRQKDLDWLEYFEDHPTSDTKTILLQSAKDSNKLKAKKNLPESFLQEREVKMSYKVIRHMFTQRIQHELPHWKFLFRQILDQVNYPNLIFPPEIKESIFKLEKEELENENF